MNLRTSTDEELMLALRQKSLAALEELYDRHHRVALAVAYRVLEDGHLAEDVIQVAFLAVWRQPESFRVELGSARSWLLSIVRHRAIDVTRGSSYKRERFSLDEDVVESRFTDVWQEVNRVLDREVVRRAVAELPPEQTEVIMQAYFGGYTQQEIAVRTQVPLGTVKGRMRLAMQKLKSILTLADEEATH